MNSFASLRSRRVALLAPVLLALFIIDPPRASAQYGNMAFTVPPGGTINIQNLSGARWYFYDAPSPTSATMFRVTEDMSQAYAWGSPQFKRDLNGGVSKVNPGEWLRVTAGSTAAGSTIGITYYDLSFDSPYSINIGVQSGTATVSSINRLDFSPSTADTVRWEITFNRAVAGVRAQNFTLTYTSNGQAVPTITSAVPSSLAHNKWIVTANRAGREAGTLQLNWNASSIERPTVPATFDGDTYDLAPPAPTTFSVRRFGYINIRNVTDDGWYFAGPPALSSVTMYRAGENENVIDQWGSEAFGPDIVGGGRNRIARNQSLRI